MDASAAESDTAHSIGDGSTARAPGQGQLRMTSADEFLASAAKEFEEGHIDPTLWARASAEFDNDKSLVIAAYLRARATELQIQKRDRQLQRRAIRAKARQDARKRNVEPEPHSEVLPAEAVGVRLRGVQLKPGYVVAMTAALASVVAVAWLMAGPQDRGPVETPGVSAAAPSAEGSAPASPVGSAQPVVGSTSDGTSQPYARPSLEAMVRQLKDAGNWNVLVLYASEWTRKEPKNSAAWSELSIGYAKLRQFDDALVAAEKAVELSPQDGLLWRNLGHLNLDVERLPEAASAFDRALALRSGDADAICGAALAAHRLGRTKDAEAMAGRLSSADGSCPGPSDAESVVVIAGAVRTRKPASPVGR
jgi:tetratricopeptide (TPR) repeat protein